MKNWLGLVSLSIKLAYNLPPDPNITYFPSSFCEYKFIKVSLLYFIKLYSKFPPVAGSLFSATNRIFLASKASLASSLTTKKYLVLSTTVLTLHTKSSTKVISKSLAWSFSSVKDVLPYLIRRAEENTSIAGQMGRELTNIIEEKKRRRNA